MYNDIIVENFSDPQNTGELESPDIEFEIGNPVCGDRIRVNIKMNGNEVEKALFRAWGCATSVATANIFCSSVKDQSIESIGSREKSEIESFLGELEPSQFHCVTILEELHAKLVELSQEKEGV